jgi:hypothetical protein
MQVQNWTRSKEVEAAAYNSTLAIGGVSSPLDSFVVAESSVLRTNFCAEKPAHRQSAKRWVPIGLAPWKVTNKPTKNSVDKTKL